MSSAIDRSNGTLTPQGRVCVVGLGYIGLPTAVAFASRGVDVIGVDINQHVIESIRAGLAPFAEPDLAIAVSGTVSIGKLTASNAPSSADAFIIAVPTPCNPERGADLSAVEAATRAIAPFLEPGNLVVLESTSPPGATVQVSRWLASERPDLRFPHEEKKNADVCIAYCPERVLPGRIMVELITNDRVVGGVGPCCAGEARSLYGIFGQGEFFLTDATTAEVVKLSENAYRDVNIAYANELSLICDEVGIDVHEVIGLANRHPRVQILQPGPGVGGHCIAVDPWFLVAAAPQSANLLRAARVVNDSKPNYVANQVQQRARRFVEPTIACLGLTFKANVDDVRESPALRIVAHLAAAGTGRILLVDPHLNGIPTELEGFDGLEFVGIEKAMLEADIVALLVDHDEFRRVNRVALRGKVVFDTRGIWA